MLKIFILFINILLWFALGGLLLGRIMTDVCKMRFTRNRFYGRKMMKNNVVFMELMDSVFSRLFFGKDLPLVSLGGGYSNGNEKRAADEECGA